GGPEPGGAVMMDEEPAAVPALEEVRRLHLCRDPAVVVTTLDVLGHDHPGEVTLHFDRGVAEREPNLERALEDALPALHHGSPADEKAPSRMDALDVRRPEPDVLHRGELEALERAVEGGVGREDFRDVAHAGLGAIMTSSTSRSGPGFRTAWSSPAGAHTRSPGRT